MNDQQHEMILEKTYATGADEWYCPTCGRRLLMDYGRKFKKTILAPGDEYAMHSGGKGGLRIGPMQAVPVDGSSTPEKPQPEDPSLAPWVAWLDKIDFESFWKSED